MKILMVHPHDIYNNFEPWTVRITYLAQELVKRGHEVKLVYHHRPPSGDDGAEYSERDYPFETIGFQRHPFAIFHNISRLEKIGGWADIVHFQKCSNYAAVPAVAAAYYHRLPVHYDWDDWEQAIFEQDNDNRIGSWIYFQQMEKHLLKLVDTVSVASSGLNRLCQQHRFPEDRTFLIPVGADLDVFHPGVDGTKFREKHGWQKKLVIYQGQISGSNYVHLYIRAAHEIIQKRDDVDFVVVGGGDQLFRAVGLAEELGITKRLTFTDKVPHEEVPGYLAAADVAVACFEDNEQVRCKSPLKIKEYMAAGKPIVASQVGDVPDMLGNTGVLVPPENYQQIGASIEVLLDDDQRRISLGEQARQRAEQLYSWRKSALTLEQAYLRAIDHHYALDG